MPIPTWLDQSGATPGTSLSANNLNAMTAADTTEAQTLDTLGASSTWVNNLDRIRYQLGQLVGGAWTAAVQMIPLSQKGAASGVASLDGSSRLVATATGGALAVNGNLSSAGTLSLAGSNGTVGATAGAGMGSGGSLAGPTVQSGSTPQRGRVSFTTGNGPAGDAVAITVTLGVTYASGCVVLVVPVWNNASGWTVVDAGYGVQHSGVGASVASFTVNMRGALQANTAYSVDYLVVG